MTQRRPETLFEIKNRVERWCSECGETKSRNEFHKDKNNPDGLYPVCKICRKKRCHKSYIKNRKTIKIKNILYRKTIRGKIARRNEYLNSIQKFPLKHQARWKIRYLIRNGKLEKKPCEVCLDKKVHAHHPDYTKPLSIIWLCQKHHIAWHKKYKPITVSTIST